MNNSDIKLNLFRRIDMLSDDVLQAPPSVRSVPLRTYKCI